MDAKDMPPGGAAAGPETVRYSLVDTSLGLLIVASSDAGVVSADIGDDAGELLDRIASRFPCARLEPDDGVHAEWVSAVVAHVETPLRAPDVPLDLRGTAFQLSVWNALLRIPVGETRSYAEVARALGRPKAFRAVARACGANPVGVAVPCHRVVASDGSLGGYAGGLGRKRELLEREGAL